jgi:hypothetical protein
VEVHWVPQESLLGFKERGRMGTRYTTSGETRLTSVSILQEVGEVRWTPSGGADHAVSPSEASA